MLTYEDYYSCAENVKQHAQFEKFLESAMFDKKKREAFYDKLHERLVDNGIYSAGIDTFKPYFEEYAAERKTNKQD